jgi:hypothetical protein
MIITITGFPDPIYLDHRGKHIGDWSMIKKKLYRYAPKLSAFAKKAAAEKKKADRAAASHRTRAPPMPSCDENPIWGAPDAFDHQFIVDPEAFKPILKRCSDSGNFEYDDYDDNLVALLRDEYDEFGEG